MALRSPLINVMVKAAEKAAKSLRRDFGEIEQLQVSRKGPADFVSTADMQAQKILREELSHARPLFGFVMEENDGIKDDEGKTERWIVDPLDGTTNFLHGLPHWCISIAMMRGKEVIAGVVHDPIKDELFWAEKGLGAYVNSKRLRVSGRKDFSECLFATGIPFKGAREDHPFVSQLKAVMLKVSGVRRFGSAALDLAYVAAGRYEGYWETGGIRMWDVAAGILLVKEAGGFVSPFEVNKDPVLDGGVIAANAETHDEFVRLLRAA